MGRVDQLSNERGLRGPAVEVVILVTGDVDAQAGALVGDRLAILPTHSQN